MLEETPPQKKESVSGFLREIEIIDLGELGEMEEVNRKNLIKELKEED